MAGPGIIGFHLVSGPLVGFCLGYGLDYWFDTGPWGKLVFLLIGIAAGFLNVYRDSRRLLKKIAAQDARDKIGAKHAGTYKDPESPNARP